MAATFLPLLNAHGGRCYVFKLQLLRRGLSLIGRRLGQGRCPSYTIAQIVHKWMLKTLRDTYQVLWEAPAHLCFPNGDVGQGSHNTAGAIMVRIK